MSVESNPFAAPQYVPPPPQIVDPQKLSLVHASKGERFANFIIDNIVLAGATFGIGLAFGVFALVTDQPELIDQIQGVPDLLLGLTIRMGYYIGLEALTGITLGKLVTGTIVVNEQGQRPTTGQVVGRSFSRIIPFEPFSFLFMTPGGWHDTLSKTHVVKKKSLQSAY